MDTNDVLAKLSDVSAMKARLEGASGDLTERIKDYYYDLGASLGYKVMRDAPVISWGINYGKIPLAWVEESSGKCVAAFEIEFGVRKHVLGSLWALIEMHPHFGVIVVSSGSTSCMPPKDIESVVQKGYMTKHTRQEFIVLDIHKATSLLVRREAEPVVEEEDTPEAAPFVRRKLIKGIKYEHKEQD